MAHLRVGAGPDALEVELRGHGDPGPIPAARLALRLAVGGRLLVGDRDDRPPTRDGLDHATASHSTVLVDALNQRESIAQAREPAPGADVSFFAADPDFQVVALEDRFAYPTAASRYRHTVVAVAGRQTRYAVSVFEVDGGFQHDQMLHAAPGVAASWRLNVPATPGPDSLLPASTRYLPTAKAEDGRWFVQALGAFGPLRQTALVHPAQALLQDNGPGVRVHLLSDLPSLAVAGRSRQQSDSSSGQDVLVLRRNSSSGSILRSRFVTVFEPAGTAAPPLQRVGRVDTTAAAVVLLLKTAEGVEHLVVNVRPGTKQTVKLADGRALTTDGVAVRVTPEGALMLAGGTMATLGGQSLRQRNAAGTIGAALPGGVFLAAGAIADPGAAAGRTLVIRHGDGTARAWTILAAENVPGPAVRFHVREETGFQLDPQTGAAQYVQYPCTRHPAPHTFSICRIAR